MEVETKSISITRLKRIEKYDDISENLCRNQKYLDYEIETSEQITTFFFIIYSRNQKYLDYEIETLKCLRSRALLFL